MVDREEFLKTRAAEGLLRILKPVSWRDNGRIRVDEKEYIDFSSNDYLGLSNHPKLIEQAKQAVDKFGTAGAASRLMSGDLELHHQLEERIAGFKNREAALFFNSGYQANVGIISALYGKGDCIFLDRLSHASIIDGAILSGGRVARFSHNDTGHLELLLKKERDKFKSAVIITESIFSMDGDKAPLKQLIQLKEKYNCEMFVDEAHATGIFGGSGSGLAEEEDKEGRIDFLMGTFSKALGGFGAYLAASRKNVEYLVNTCRSFIYSTSLPAGVIAGNLAGIEVIKEEPFRRERLLEAAEYFRRSLKNRGFQVSGESQIIPVIIGENLKTQRFAAELREKGYWVLPVRPPTVPNGEARLRFSLTFGHTREILAKFIDDFSDIRI